MSPLTVNDYGEVMKETWTSDELETQFYEGLPWLKRIERTNRYTIGEEAHVPIIKDLSGATTVHDAVGGALNPTDKIKVDRATYKLAYTWQRVDIEFGTLNQAGGGAHSVGDALDEEVTNGLLAANKSVERQALSNGDALIAETGVTAASTTVKLAPAGYGYDAIVRRWLYPGQTIDIGTAANEASAAFDRQIVSVKRDPAVPEIVVSGAAVTTAANDFVSIANARAGAVSKEMNGLRQIAGSKTLAVGGLDPDTAGESFWQPAAVDTTTTTLSLDLALELQRAVFQETGDVPADVWTSAKQQAVFYSLLQNQVRFPGEMKLGAGDVDQPTWNNLKVNAVPSIPDREWYMLTLKDFLIVTGEYSKPTWASDVEGSNRGLMYTIGATNFQDAIVYALNLAIRRRNSQAAAIGLTA